MKKEIIMLACLVCTTIIVQAQTEKFDMASFTAPHGWQRTDSNGKLGFFDAKTENGQTRFCQILLYPSQKSSGDVRKDFTALWNSKIVKATQYQKKPKTSISRSEDGWMVMNGFANITQRGMTYTCWLTTFSGFGKTMSVLVNMAGKEYVDVVNNFFRGFNLDKNETAGAPITEPASSNNPPNMQVNAQGDLNSYVYAVPPGWTMQAYADGIVLSAPPNNTGERCNITLWPMRSASGNLKQDAESLFAEVFKAFDPHSSSTPNSMIRGVSAQGWNYFIIKRSIILRGGDFQSMFGFAFVAQLNNQIACISGISKDPLVSSCFGLQLSDVWPQFFYSLHFRNWNAQPENPVLKRLPGVWTAVTGTAGDRFAFAPNGRYAGAAAAQRYVRVSSSEILRITDAYFGDGAYSIRGNALVLQPDAEKNNPETCLVRAEEESRDEGRTWNSKLYLLRKSRVDGNMYEVGYEKQ